MKVTFRDVKVFFIGMIGGLVIALTLSVESLNQQQIIANAVETGVIISVLLMIFSTLFTVAVQVVKRFTKEFESK